MLADRSGKPTTNWDDLIDARVRRSRPTEDCYLPPGRGWWAGCMPLLSHPSPWGEGLKSLLPSSFGRGL